MEFPLRMNEVGGNTVATRLIDKSIKLILLVLATWIIWAIYHPLLGVMIGGYVYVRMALITLKNLNDFYEINK